MTDKLLGTIGLLAGIGLTLIAIDLLTGGRIASAFTAPIDETVAVNDQ